MDAERKGVSEETAMGRGGSHVSNKELSAWVKEVEGDTGTDDGRPSLHGPPDTQSIDSEESPAAAPPVIGPPSDSGGCWELPV